MKLCPLLLREGFLNEKGKMRPEKNWIEEVCRDCPLEKSGGGCVYDKAEPVSETDRGILLGGKDATKN